MFERTKEAARWRSLRRCQAQKQTGGRSWSAPPVRRAGNPSLLQAVQGHVEGKLRHHRRAAPVGIQTSWIVDRDRAWVEGSRLSACPDRALGRRQAGVPITNIQRKYLPSETDTYVPCRIVDVLEAGGIESGSVERIAVTYELSTVFSRHIPAGSPELPRRCKFQGA